MPGEQGDIENITNEPEVTVEQDAAIEILGDPDASEEDVIAALIILEEDN